MTPTPSDRRPGDGLFVVSLDFELHWGIRDHTSVEAARDRLLGAREAIPVMLREFARRGVRATWATVGMLCAPDKRTLMALVPDEKPRYRRMELSPYPSLSSVGEDERSDPFHFAPSIVDQIVRTPGQELGTHTFSHYYCLEEGQSGREFAADLDAAARIAARAGLPPPRSIVFPRNQVNDAYLALLAAAGVRAYRTNPDAWPYRATTTESENALRRAARLVDAYVPAFRTAASVSPPRSGLRAVPASAFLRPWSRRLRHLDRVRARRLRGEMDAAARDGSVFHLWWHPHNFGTSLRENMAFLGHLLDHFESHRRAGRMRAATMAEAAEWTA